MKNQIIISNKKTEYNVQQVKL